MMRRLPILTFLAASLLIVDPMNAAPAGETGMTRLPIQEVTAFKDGNTLVIRQGDVPVTSAGDVVLTELPAPLLGTFWPSVGGGARLSSVVAGQQEITTVRSAQSITDLLAANPNADVTIIDTLNSGRFDATIIKILSSGDANTDGLVLLKTAEGQRVLPIRRIADLTFKNAPTLTQAGEAAQPQLTLHLDWNGKTPEKNASVGMMYVQKGLRWIPQYKIDLDGHGKATAEFAATLVNDLADLDHVTANLVIGVPKFVSDGVLDPISLQDTVAALAGVSAKDAYFNGGMNAYATQVPAYREAADASSASPGPQIEGGARNEDLFVFPVRNVTMRRSERMNLPIQTLPLTYKDVYTLDLTPTPPLDVLSSLNSTQQDDLAQKIATTHVIHVVRMHDTAAVPLTTAPALLLANGRVLDQARMTYTPVGGHVDLEAGTALDVPVTQTGHETKRTPNTQEWQGYQYARVDLTGTIAVTNDHPEAISLEVTREVAGVLDDADTGGAVEQADPLSDSSLAYARSGLFNSYNWWGAVNGIGRATWTLTVPPGKTVHLKYNWHYFWR